MTFIIFLNLVGMDTSLFRLQSNVQESGFHLQEGMPRTDYCQAPIIPPIIVIYFTLVKAEHIQL